MHTNSSIIATKKAGSTYFKISDKHSFAIKITKPCEMYGDINIWSDVLIIIFYKLILQNEMHGVNNPKKYFPSFAKAYTVNKINRTGISVQSIMNNIRYVFYKHSQTIKYNAPPFSSSTK